MRMSITVDGTSVSVVAKGGDVGVALHSASCSIGEYDLWFSLHEAEALASMILAITRAAAVQKDGGDE